VLLWSVEDSTRTLNDRSANQYSDSNLIVDTESTFVWNCLPDCVGRTSTNV
jgi:hypothetical protein